MATATTLNKWNTQCAAITRLGYPVMVEQIARSWYVLTTKKGQTDFKTNVAVEAAITSILDAVSKQLTKGK